MKPSSFKSPLVLVGVIIPFAAFAGIKQDTQAIKQDTQTIKSDEQTVKALAYDADLFSKDREVVFANMEFLYRTMLVSGLEYVSKMKGDVPSSQSTTSGPLGDYKKAKFDWMPGFRVAFGYFNAPKFWDVFAQYTWFETRGNSGISTNPSTGEYLQPTVPLRGTPNGSAENSTVESAKQDVHYRFNLAEGLVSRDFFPNEHLRLRFVGGLTSTWQNQSVTSRYLIADGTTSKTSTQWGYWGVGFRIGAHSDWYWGKNFYFTGRASAALVIGHYVNRLKTYYQDSPTTDFETLANSHYADYRGAYNFNFSIGPSWQKSYPRVRYELFTGYEIDSWFNLAEFRRYETADNSATHPTDVQSSSIAMNGVTVRLTVAY